MDLMEAFDYSAASYEGTGIIASPLGNELYSGKVNEPKFDWQTLLGQAISTGINVVASNNLTDYGYGKKLSDYGYPVGAKTIQATPTQTPVRVDVPGNYGTRQTGLSLPNSVGSIISGINPTYLMAGLFIVLLIIMKRSG